MDLLILADAADAMETVSEGRNDEEPIEEEQDIFSKTTSKRKKSVGAKNNKGKKACIVDDYSESDEEPIKPKKKMKATESSSHVSVHVDVIKFQKHKKKLQKAAYEERTKSSDEETDVKSIETIMKRKGKKIVANEKKKDQLVAAVVRNKETRHTKKNMKVVAAKKRKQVETQNEDDENEDEDTKKERVSLQTRMSPSNLKKIIETCTPAQMKALEEMGFGNFKDDFNFNSTPTSLGLWILQNFDVKKCSLTLSNNRKIKVTRELIHDILGIPMGDIKVVALRETSTEDPTTARWRETLPLTTYDRDGPSHKKKIPISMLEAHLSVMSDDGWPFKVGFLVVFFSIFAHGNKDGSINQRFLPSLENMEQVPNLDWCSYCLECMLAEIKMFKTTSFFAGPLLLLVLIYVNSTISTTTIVNRTLPAFKAWSTKLLKQREKEERTVGFGHLPIVEGLQLIETPKENLKKKRTKIQESGELDENIIHQLLTPRLQLTNGLYGTINRDEELQQFKSKSVKEMREYIALILAKSKELILDINEKIKIALSTYPDDEEINILLEERNTHYKELYNFTEISNEGDKAEED